MLKIIKSDKKITVDEINNFESEFNIKLPNDYKIFLLQYNGGFPEDDMIFPYTDDKFGKFSILIFDNLKNLKRGILEFLNKPGEDYLNIIKNEVTSFCMTSNNFPLCIGYGKKNKGKIYILDQEEIYGTSLILISNSFTEFMNKFKKSY